jgi:hypothetical protein
MKESTNAPNAGFLADANDTARVFTFAGGDSVVAKALRRDGFATSVAG